MAIFINKKEEVISLTLTQYGRHLFSKGALKPAYYSFYDDDILYDGAYAGLASSSQNENVTRIKDTPRLKINPIYQIMNLDAPQNDHVAGCVEKANIINSSPIGTADPWSDFAPAWKIRPILDSQYFSGSVSYSASLGQKSRIPQIDIDIEYRYDQSSINDPKIIQIVEDPRVVLSVEEINTVYKNTSNFEIEVYEIENATRYRNGTDGAPVLRRLEFAHLGTEEEKTAMERTWHDPSYYTFARDDERTEQQFPVLDRKHVEHYMIFRVDKEIQDSVLISEPSPLYVAQEYVAPEDCD